MPFTPLAADARRRSGKAPGRPGPRCVIAAMRQDQAAAAVKAGRARPPSRPPGRVFPAQRPHERLGRLAGPDPAVPAAGPGPGACPGGRRRAWKTPGAPAPTPRAAPALGPGERLCRGQGRRGAGAGLRARPAARARGRAAHPARVFPLRQGRGLRTARPAPDLRPGRARAPCAPSCSTTWRWPTSEVAGEELPEWRNHEKFHSRPMLLGGS